MIWWKGKKKLRCHFWKNGWRTELWGSLNSAWEDKKDIRGERKRSQRTSLNQIREKEAVIGRWECFSSRIMAGCGSPVTGLAHLHWMKIKQLEIKLLKRLSIWTLKPPMVNPWRRGGMSQIPKASVTVVERSGTEWMTVQNWDRRYISREQEPRWIKGWYRWDRVPKQHWVSVDASPASHGPRVWDNERCTHKEDPGETLLRRTLIFT